MGGYIRAIAMANDDFVTVCDAINALLDYQTEVHEDDDSSIWSLGLHCLTRFLKYHQRSLKDLLYICRRFHSANASPQLKQTDWSKQKKWIKRI